MLVDKRISNKPNIIAEFRIHPEAMIKNAAGALVSFVPPEWDDKYGKHPHSS